MIISRYISEKKSLWLFVIVVGVVFSVLNWLTPMVRDDYFYKYVSYTGAADPSQPIRTFWDVIISQVDHFIYHNGRALVHILYQSVDGLAGKWMFNVLNPFVFCVYLFLIIKYAIGRVSLPSMVVTVSLLVFAMPVFQEFYLWMAGAFNYLWSSVLVFYFLIVLRKHEKGQLTGASWKWLLLGLLAGWTHEGISIPLSVGVLIAAIIFGDVNRRSEAWWMKVAFFTGAMICMLSSLSQEKTSASASIAERLIYKWKIGMLTMGELRMIYIFIVVLLVLLILRKIHVKAFFRQNAPLFIAILVTFAIVFYSGIPNNTRTAYMAELGALLLLLRMFTYIHLNHRIRKIILSFLITALLVYTVPLVYYSHINYQEHQDIEAQLNEGRQLVLLNSRKMPWIIQKNICRTINVCNCNLGIFDPDSDLCRAFAANYGLEYMSFCPEQFLDILQNTPEQLDTLNDCGGLPIYVIRWNDEGPVVSVKYELSEEEGGKPFYKRWLPSWFWGIDETRLFTNFAWVKIDDDYYVFMNKLPKYDKRVVSVEIISSDQ